MATGQPLPFSVYLTSPPRKHKQLHEEQSLSYHLGTQEWAQVTVSEHQGIKRYEHSPSK